MDFIADTDGAGGFDGGVEAEIATVVAQYGSENISVLRDTRLGNERHATPFCFFGGASDEAGTDLQLMPNP